MTEASHPLGLIDNPEWAASRYRREELYLEERARLYAKPRREWCRPTFFLLVASVSALAVAAVSMMGGV